MNRPPLRHSLFGRIFIGLTTAWLIVVAVIGLVTYTTTVTTHQRSVRKLHESTFSTLIESVVAVTTRIVEEGYRFGELGPTRMLVLERIGRPDSYVKTLFEHTLHARELTTLDTYLDTVLTYSPVYGRLFLSGAYPVEAEAVPSLRARLDLAMAEHLRNAWVFLDERSRETLQVRSSFAVVIPVPVFSVLKSGVVMLVIDHQSLSDYLARISPAGSLFGIMSPSGAVVVGDASLADRLEASAGGRRSGRSERDADYLVLRAAVSGHTGWEYVFTVAKDRRASRAILVAFGAFALGIGPLVYLLLQRLYRPLSVYIDELADGTGRVFAAKPGRESWDIAEINALTTALERVSDKARTLVNESRRQRHQFFLRNLLSDPGIAMQFPTELRQVTRAEPTARYFVVLASSSSDMSAGERAAVDQLASALRLVVGRRRLMVRTAVLCDAECALVCSAAHDDVYETVGAGLPSIAHGCVETGLVISLGSAVASPSLLPSSYGSSRLLRDASDGRPQVVDRRVVLAREEAAVERVMELLEDFQSALTPPDRVAAERVVEEIDKTIASAAEATVLRTVVAVSVNRIVRRAAGRHGLTLASSLDLGDITERSLDSREIETVTSLTQPAVESFFAAVTGISAGSRRCLAAIEYLRTHFDDPQLSLKLLASEFRTSESTIARWLKDTTGRTFRETLLELRMEEACRLLVRPDPPDVRDTAVRSGYHDYRSFVRAFKSRLGKTPTQFRRSVIEHAGVVADTD